MRNLQQEKYHDSPLIGKQIHLHNKLVSKCKYLPRCRTNLKEFIHIQYESVLPKTFKS